MVKKDLIARRASVSVVLTALLLTLFSPAVNAAPSTGSVRIEFEDQSYSLSGITCIALVPVNDEGEWAQGCDYFNHLSEYAYFDGVKPGPYAVAVFGPLRALSVSWYRGIPDPLESGGVINVRAGSTTEIVHRLIERTEFVVRVPVLSDSGVRCVSAYGAEPPYVLWEEQCVEGAETSFRFEELDNHRAYIFEYYVEGSESSEWLPAAYSPQGALSVRPWTYSWPFTRKAPGSISLHATDLEQNPVGTCVTIYDAYLMQIADEQCSETGQFGFTGLLSTEHFAWISGADSLSGQWYGAPGLAKGEGFASAAPISVDTNAVTAINVALSPASRVVVNAQTAEGLPLTNGACVTLVESSGEQVETICTDTGVATFEDVSAGNYSALVKNADGFRSAWPEGNGSLPSSRHLVDFTHVVAGGELVFDVKLTPSAPSSFHDVAANNTFKDAIEYLAAEGIVTGNTAGEFKPSGLVSRQAMAAFLYRLAGEPEISLPSSSPFWDVPRTHQFFREIYWLSQAGISTGYSDGAFRPADRVSRQAMAAFLYRLDGQPEIIFSTPFWDIPAGSAFRQAIKWMYLAGLTKGYSDGSFRPSDGVTRQAMAAFMARMMDESFAA